MNSSQFYSASVGLSEGAFTLLRDMIHEKTGLFYEAQKRDLLGDKLASLVLNRGMDNFLDYYYFLKYDQQAELEWVKVMDALSVQETYFYREADQIKTLVDIVVPKYARENPLQPLRIWSAACASGEEPLSIAMALEESGWFSRHPIEIYASDASTSALEKARGRLYRERSFRNLSPALSSKYFSKKDGLHEVSPEIHSRIRWSQANVFDEKDIFWLAGSHVIFCRNMFIYFSEQTIRKTVQFFSDRMPSPGYLFVGAAESLLKMTNDFRLENMGGAFVYVK